MERLWHYGIQKNVARQDNSRDRDRAVFRFDSISSGIFIMVREDRKLLAVSP